MMSLNFLYWEQYVEPQTRAVLVHGAEVQLGGRVFEADAVELDLVFVRLIGDRNHTRLIKMI